MPSRTAQQHIPRSVANKGGSSRGIPWLTSAAGALAAPFLGPAGPILGSLVGAGLNFGLNRIESGIQNRYNAPKNQMKRLAEAGLPGAAYFDKQQPESAGQTGSYAQPDLGTAEAISREQVNRMQKQQFELMKREMAVKEQEVLLKQAQENKARQDAAKTYQDTRYGTAKADYYAAPGNFARQIETGNLLRENQAKIIELKAAAQQMENEVYAEFKKEGGQLRVLQGIYKGQDSTRATQAAQRAVSAQNIQESAQRIAKMLVDIEQTKAQTSLATQLERQRQLKGEIISNMQEDIANGTGGMAWLGAMLLRISGL